jgi:2'-5' RNA ligase
VSAREQATVRAFVALELEAPVREAIRDLQAQLRPRLAGIRMVQPEGIHLTLRFLGETTLAQAETIGAALGGAAARCAPARAAVGGLGVFPGRGDPRVLWLGVEVPAAIVELQQNCERAAQAAGFAREERPFRAHLTLGRWRERAPRPELPRVELGEARLDRLVLYRSELLRDGAVYAPLRRFALGTG